jgi:hypothetical protein
MYRQGISVQEERGLHMDAKTVLTGFLGEPISRPDLVDLLAEAGLELWQAPEGFWAVRLKQASADTSVSRLRLRRPPARRAQ